MHLFGVHEVGELPTLALVLLIETLEYRNRSFTSGIDYD
jgi:hypothetical protein